ncbi:3 beta-hydroxysteroid dehydrogenase type 7 isoform X1 [Rhineura floridana]|uniref:3 beta-hydroxysteroid dehydrogenase type 7 isoform X1 n=1 Tax=Rhineura floridana TaxID=261503 RepID=UPI002AC82879|nr:3 beta-hydroxysteroid dehydrogenase type 7 isoform X1 [Rhineura floridana]
MSLHFGIGLEWRLLILIRRTSGDWFEILSLTTPISQSLESSPSLGFSYFQAIFDDPSSLDQPSFTIPIDCPQWPPVTGTEIDNLISQLCSGKAPGQDLLPAELYQSFPLWWRPILAALFTKINETGYIPHSWKMSIVVPIFKKRDPTKPSNFRPISLLDVVAKLYGRFLLNKLLDWDKEQAIISDAQAGFREGASTLHQLFILHHLITHVHMNPQCSLYLAFIDFSAAFDSINRRLLWSKLEKAGINKRLLWLLQSLHQDTVLRIRLGHNGLLSQKNLMRRGVKQGCILAPFLFNFFINDIVPAMSSPSFFPPSIKDRKVPVLLYADDLLLLSQNRLGFKRMLSQFQTYCATQCLHINYSKTKIMICGKYSKVKSIWHLNGHTIEQVHTFKYLGIYINNKLSWAQQLAHIKLVALKALGLLKKFFYSKGGQLMRPMSKLYISKILPKIMYGCEIWGPSLRSALEPIQNTFFKQILGLPKGTPAAHMRIELKSPSLMARADLAFLRLWKKFSEANPSSLAKLCWEVQLEKGGWAKNFMPWAFSIF